MEIEKVILSKHAFDKYFQHVPSDCFLLDLEYQRVEKNGKKLAEINLYLKDNLTLHRVTLPHIFPYIYIEASEEEIKSLKSESVKFKEWLVDYDFVSKKEYRGGNEVKLTKIRGKEPWIVPEIRDILDSSGIKHHESDIPFIHRFLIDSGLHGLNNIKFDQINDNQVKIVNSNNTQSLKVMSFDIEIDSSVNSDEMKESVVSILGHTNRRITAISLAWGTDQEHFQSKVFPLKIDDDAKEKKLIIDFFRFVWTKVKPDILLTYNGDQFDFPYLIGRMNVLNLSPTLCSPFNDRVPRKPSYGKGFLIPGILVYDLFRRTRHIHTLDGKKSLNSVSNKLLGDNKMEISLNHGELWRAAILNDKRMKEFVDYSKKDAELTYRLFFSMNILEWLEVIKITGLPPGEGMYYTERQAGEFLVFRFMSNNQVIIPKSPSSEEKMARKKDHKVAKGGLVLEPSRELTSSVLICDFTSMYPSIIAAHNVGSESFNGLTHPIKDRFDMEPKTTMALMQEYMLHQRIDVKKELRNPKLGPNTIDRLKKYNQALKIVANSTFGSYNFIGSRLYNTLIAGTITEIGRTYLREISEKVKEFDKDFDTIYGDTDSVFIETTLNAEITEIWNSTSNEILDYGKFAPRIDELMLYLRQTLPNIMKLELQDIAFRILFHKGAKKRYTYVSAISKKVFIIGLEAVRHDWSQFAKDIQKKTIGIILRTGDLALAKSEIIEFIRKKVSLDEKKLLENLTTFGPIKRKPEKYKSLPPAVAAFEHFAKVHNIDPKKEWKYYDLFPFIIVKGKGVLKDRARHPDFVTIKMVDLNHYLRRSLAAINRFNVNISIDEVNQHLYGDLEKFFQKND